MSSSVPTASTATAVPVVSGAAIAATDDARWKRWNAVLRRIAAAISAAHTARVPF